MLGIESHFFGDDEGGPAKTFAETDQASSSGTTITFSGRALGAADAGRLIVVAISCSNNSKAMTLNSATIGGVSATIAVQVTKGGNSVNPTNAIIYATVPTGTTGNIVLTFSRTANTCYIVVYRATGLSSNTVADTASAASGNPQTLSVDIPSGGGFAVAASSSVSTSNSTWSGLTENWENNANSTCHSIADTAGIVSQATPLAVSVSGVNSGNGNSVSASWG